MAKINTEELKKAWCECQALEEEGHHLFDQEKKENKEKLFHLMKTMYLNHLNNVTSIARTLPRFVGHRIVFHLNECRPDLEAAVTVERVIQIGQIINNLITTMIGNMQSFLQ